MIAAPSCKAVLSQATKAWPNRDTGTDGIIPSAAHRAASPNSDHNPAPPYWLCHAVDLTQDKAHGCDCHAIFDAIRNARDNRVKLLIFEHRMWTPEGGVQTYSHSDHFDHLHISVKNTFSALFNVSAWPGIKKPIPLVQLSANLDQASVEADNGTWLYGYLLHRGNPEPRMPVRVQYFYLGTWRTAKVVYTDNTGRWGSIVRPKKTTTYRGAFFGSATLPSCRSASVKLTVI
jgi:hypothetical protein